MRTGYTLLTVTAAMVFAMLLVVSITSPACAQGAGKALDFDGSEDYVEVPDNDGLNITEKLTMEVWVRFAGEAVPDRNHFILFKHNGISGQYGIARYDETKGANAHKFFAGLYTGSWTDYVSDYVLEDNIWYHIVVTFDGTDVKLYVNGNLDKTISAGASSLTGGSGVLEIGRESYWSPIEYANGAIEEVRIWNVIRTQADIQAYMCKKLAGTESNLVGYWRFDDQEDPTDDYSNQSNKGYLKPDSGEPNFVDSTAPIASSTVEALTDVGAVWSGDDQNASAQLDVDASGLSGTDRAVFGHNDDALTANTFNVPGGINRRWNRVWTFDEVGTVTATFTFTVPSGQITDKSEVWLLESSSSTDFSSAAQTGTPITSGGLTEMQFTNVSITHGSSYTIASTTADNSLPVTLTSFTAQAGDGKVTLHWVTESEIDNLGFHMYRALEAEGIYQQLTSEVIEGAGTSTGRREYVFTDVRLTNGVTYWYKIEDMAFDGTRTMHGPISVMPQAEETVEVQALPAEFGLSQNFPNPFNPATEIRYQLPEASYVGLAIYDVLGQQVRVLVDGFVEAGYRSVVWDAKEVGSGVYFIRMEAGDFLEVRKMVLIR